MSKLTLQTEITFDARECPECGVRYAVTEEFARWRIQDHQTFYCPNGHTRYHPAQNETEVLRERLAAEQARLRSVERERDFERTRAANAEKKAKAAATRVAHGVCPCCNRTFKQLAAHMKNKHPEHVEAHS